MSTLRRHPHPNYDSVAPNKPVKVVMQQEPLNLERLDVAFEGRPDLVANIKMAADTRFRIALFNDISSYVQELQTGEPALKRRRIDDSSTTPDGVELGQLGIAPARPPKTTPVQPYVNPLPPPPGSLLIDLAKQAAEEVVLLAIKAVTIISPQRKKVDLCFSKTYLFAKTSDSDEPVQGMVWSWADIEYIFYMPVPEKAILQHNYCLLPKGVALSSTKTMPDCPLESFVFSVPTTAPKPGTVTGYAARTAVQVSDSYTTLFDWAINAQLQSAGNTATIVATNPNAFHSAVRQPHRPGEKAVFVKAFRGSKDGYLYFLPTGILWAFKKPLLFMPFERILSVSYTNVLQRTFNLVVELDVSAELGQGKQLTEDLEFGMIDQEDYANISETYVKRHGLQDRSMAEQRKAKRQLAENAKNQQKNGKTGEVAAVAGAGTAGDPIEVQQANQALDEDDDDEEEEDYDPGSEGESEGEGESSEEEEEEAGQGGNAQ